jgi:hypothetical protein
MGRTSDLKGACTGDQSFVFDRVFGCAEAVAEGVLDLLDRMCVWAFDEECDGFGFFDVFDKGVFFFAESVFVHEACPA